jgi:bifunctional DNA-binding transcriptional regulator/antitoxin component of YhaV-PrlF toxin-antitoxin module
VAQTYSLTLPLIYAKLLQAITSTINVICMNHVIHTKLGEGRRVAIPAELCQEYGLQTGDPLVMEASAAGIVLRPLDTVIHELQAFFADAAPAKVRLSDELSRDRRAEAEREDRG